VWEKTGDGQGGSAGPVELVEAIPMLGVFASFCAWHFAATVLSRGASRSGGPHRLSRWSCLSLMV
jgi:hypothetical protein